MHRQGHKLTKIPGLYWIATVVSAIAMRLLRFAAAGESHLNGATARQLHDHKGSEKSQQLMHLFPRTFDAQNLPFDTKVSYKVSPGVSLAVLCCRPVVILHPSFSADSGWQQRRQREEKRADSLPGYSTSSTAHGRPTLTTMSRPVRRRQTSFMRAILNAHLTRCSLLLPPQTPLETQTTSSLVGLEFACAVAMLVRSRFSIDSPQGRGSSRTAGWRNRLYQG